MSGFSSLCGTFISVCNQPPRSTQPGYPFMGRRNWVPGRLWAVVIHLILNTAYYNSHATCVKYVFCRLWRWTRTQLCLHPVITVLTLLIDCQLILLSRVSFSSLSLYWPSVKMFSRKLKNDTNMKIYVRCSGHQSAAGKLCCNKAALKCCTNNEICWYRKF